MIALKQGNVGDCYLIATLHSLQKGLNTYARETKNPAYNAVSWLKALMEKGSDGV